MYISANLCPELVSIAKVYLDRMLEATGIALQPDNWARAVVGSIILAAKVWDDHAVWTVDFCQIFPDVEVLDLYISLI